MRARNAIERVRREFRLVAEMLVSDLRSQHGEAAAQMAQDRFDALDEVLVEEEVIHTVAIGYLERSA